MIFAYVLLFAAQTRLFPTKFWCTFLTISHGKAGLLRTRYKKNHAYPRYKADPPPGCFSRMKFRSGVT